MKKILDLLHNRRFLLNCRVVLTPPMLIYTQVNCALGRSHALHLSKILGSARDLLLALSFLFISCTSFANSSSNPLPVEQAFTPSATVFGPDTVVLNWQIAPNHYLYQARFHFSLENPNGTEIGHIIYPQGIWKEDQIFGKYQVYFKHVRISVPLIHPKPDHTILNVSYQGCSEAGYCYPPTSVRYQIHFTQGSVEKLASGAPPAPNLSSHPKPKAEEATLSHSVMQVMWFFWIGVLLSLTPCVLPMLPILSGIILGHQKTQMRGKAFRLSLVYVLSMAVTYALAGVLVGWLGGTVQSVFQKPWIILLSSFLFVLLACSFFGLYSIRLPARFESYIAKVSGHQKKGHYLGVAAMGCLATLIVSPCVTPALVGILGYITHTGDAALGGLALFTMGLGMGVPLLVVGLLGNRVLPKAGPWMQEIEYLFGVLFLAMAIWMLNRLFPAPVILMLWSVLALVCAVYLGALSHTPERGWGKFHKGLGIVLLVYGVLLAVGAAQGHDDPLQPLVGEATVSSPANPAITVTTLDELDTALKEAKDQHKPVMVDFYADWCVSCQEMKRTVLRGPTVAEALSHFIVIKADVTKNDALSKALMQKYQVVAPPTFVFFNRDGEWLKSNTLVGYTEGPEFLKCIQVVTKS